MDCRYSNTRNEEATANLILMPFCVIARKLVSSPQRVTVTGASAAAARLTRFSSHHRQFFFSVHSHYKAPSPALSPSIALSTAEDNQFFQLRSDLPPGIAAATGEEGCLHSSPGHRVTGPCPLSIGEKFCEKTPRKNLSQNE